jgi:catechol 2,3-dioxygenase-like lactoylglutathione lyase family enzyme
MNMVRATRTQSTTGRFQSIRTRIPIYATRRDMRIGSIVIRSYEFEKMLAFWQEALGYLPREPARGGWVVLQDPTGKGPNVSLDQYPTRRTGKRSRVHVDLYTDDQQNEVERLLSLGASCYPWRYRPGDDYVVLADPDDNLFCVVQVRDT